jgi:AcrR family transcriptional regulator
VPAVAKTSEAELVRAARQIVEKAGPSALSMQLVADAVGIRAPSLYKRFADRDALLDAVALDAIGDLAAALGRAAEGKTPRAALVAMGNTYRTFAKRRPGIYALLFAERREAAAVVAARADAVRPVLAALAALVPEAEALPAARMLTAFLHGFVSMEISGAFKLGGGVPEAFAFGLEKIVASLGQQRKRGAEIDSP